MQLLLCLPTLKPCHGGQHHCTRHIHNFRCTEALHHAAAEFERQIIIIAGSTRTQRPLGCRFWWSAKSHPMWGAYCPVAFFVWQHSSLVCAPRVKVKPVAMAAAPKDLWRRCPPAAALEGPMPCRRRPSAAVARPLRRLGPQWPAPAAPAPVSSPEAS